MRSASLCFNAPLFKKQTRRFWPLWSLYILGLTFMFPCMILMQRAYWGRGTESVLSSMNDFLLTMAAESAPWITAIYAILVAMAVWSYLYNHRSVSMIHALPLSRGGLFASNYVTGLLFGIVPHVLVFVLSIPACLLAGGMPMKSLLLWLLVQSLLYFFFFSFATLIAFVTGQLLALPILYVVFNGVAGGLYLLLQAIFSGFVYGYAGMPLPGLSTLCRWTTPLWNLVLRLGTEQVDLSDTAILTAGDPMYVSKLNGLSTVAIYAVIGLVMALLAYLLYRRRKLELCGETVAVTFLRPVFKYSVGICSGLAMGILCTAFFSDYSYSYSPSFGMLLCFTAFWCAMGYFAADMLLHKSFRVFHKKNWGVLVLALVLVGGLSAIEFDLIGYEKNIPSADQVIEIRQVGERMASTDPAAIAATLELHKSLVENKAENERLNLLTRVRYSDVTSPDDLSTSDWTYVNIDYKLANGESLERQYSIPVHPTLLADPASPASQYQKLLNNPSWVLNDFFPSAVKDKDLTLIEVQAFDGDRNVDAEKNAEQGIPSDHFVQLVGKDAQELLSAVREDIAAGRLCQSFLIDWRDKDSEARKTNYANVIYFTFRGAYNDTNLVNGAGRWDSESLIDDNGNWLGEKVTGYTVDFRLQRTATKTLAVLAKHGLLPDKNLLSEAQAFPDGASYSGNPGSALTTPESYYGDDSRQSDSIETTIPVEYQNQAPAAEAIPEP